MIKYFEPDYDYHLSDIGKPDYYKFMSELTPITIVVAIFAFFALIQVFYYLYFFARLAFYKENKQQQGKRSPVSVIICGRNEYENFKKNLPRFFDQDYPEYEVVVVNDCSVDDTEDLLKEFAESESKLKIVKVTENDMFRPGKKFALTMGIKAAKYDDLLLADADCIPKSRNWISLMHRNFSDQKELILGYGAYEKKSGLLNKLVRFDVFYVAVQYLSFALAGNPYMGVGRNLAYRKHLFFNNKGFASHSHIASGDDDLFINEVATGKNTAIEIDPDSHTLSVPKQTFMDWWVQKRRHLTTGPKYKLGHKIRLSGLIISQIMFYIFFIIALIQGEWLAGVLSLFFFRMLIQIAIFKKCADKLDENDLVIFSPFYDLIITLFIPIVFISNKLYKSNRWKRN